MTFLVLDRKYDTGNMAQIVKDFDCQKGINREISEKKDPDEDLYFDEELDSYLNQLEAIPIELFEENCGDSSDGSEEHKNTITKRTQAASRNALECPSTTEEANSLASTSSFTAKTDFNVLQKERQEEDSKLSVASINSQMGSDLEEDSSIAVCGQMISRSRQKTVRADAAKNTYGKCKEEFSEEESFSVFENPKRIAGSEVSPARTRITNYVKGISKLETDPERTKKGEKRKERVCSKNCLSDGRTKNSVNAEKIMGELVFSTREQGGVETDIISCMEATCRCEIEPPVPQTIYCDGSNVEDDKDLISLDIIRTEHNLLRSRRDSSSSLSSSFSGRETVVLPLEDPRLPHLKEEKWCPSPNKLKTCAFEHSSSSKSVSQSVDTIGVISEREPSPFPISKAVSDIASCETVPSVIETKNDLALPKADHFKTTSDCIKISSKTCESDPILTQKRKKDGLLEKKQANVIDLERRSSPSLSPVTGSCLNSDSSKGECEVLQTKVIARKQGPRTPSPHTPPRVTASDLSTLGDKSLTPAPPKYSGSASAHGMLHKSKISPILVSMEQQTDELRAPADSRSDCSSKAEVTSNKLKDNLHGSCVVQGTRFSTPNDRKSTSISPERGTVDCKSVSPVSSCSSHTPVRKRSRSRTVDCKSVSPVSSCSSRTPVRKRSRSKTVDCKSLSPVSSCSSPTPVKKRSTHRSRTVDCKSLSPVSSCSSPTPVKKRSTCRSRTVDCKSLSPVSSCSAHTPAQKRSRSRTVDRKSTSPVSSCSSCMPVRKRSRSRRQRRSWKSQSVSPFKYRRHSRSMSPLRRNWENQRSNSKSVSPPRWKSKSRSPWRRRAGSKSRVISRFCRSRSRGRKSRSPRRGSRSRRDFRSRRGSPSPRRGSRYPRRGSQSRRDSQAKRSPRSPRRYSRSPRRVSQGSQSRRDSQSKRSPRSPRRYSRSPRRVSRGSQSRRSSRSPRRYSRSPRRYSRSPRRVSRKRIKRSSSLSLSPPSVAERRMRLKEKTETALCSIVAALNGTQTTTAAVSVTRRQTAPAANTVSSVPSGALPVVQVTQVQKIVL